MKYIKLFENINDTVDLVFYPSGEVIQLTEDQISKIGEYLFIDYETDFDCYSTDDDFRDMVVMVLNDKNFMK